MVVQDPLDFSLLLEKDYVYAMKAIVSTLFHVISFPHDGRVVTVDQLSFIDPRLDCLPEWFLYADGITPTTGQLCGVVTHGFNF
jgi:hypothetical protein